MEVRDWGSIQFYLLEQNTSQKCKWVWIASIEHGFLSQFKLGCLPSQYRIPGGSVSLLDRVR